METVEQLSQAGTALSGKNLSMTALMNHANTLTGIRLQTEGFTQAGAFAAKLELPAKSAVLPESGSLEQLKLVHLGSDVISRNDGLLTKHKISRLSVSNNLIGSTKLSAFNSKATAVDPLTGIAKGDALAHAVERNVFSVRSKAVLDEVIHRTSEQLASFANDEAFLDKMHQAFGEDWQPQVAHRLIQQLAEGEAMPKIEVLSGTVLNANGAFGQGTIYLSEKFLSENADNPEAVVSVLLEEIGHSVDQVLNRIDAPGDEGDVFARLAQNQKIDSAELKTLRAEDDSATIVLNGQAIAVEFATPSFPGHLIKYTPGASLRYDEAAKQWQQRMKDRGWRIAVDGLYGAQSKAVCIAFQKEKGLAADGIVGPDTWNKAFDNLIPINPPLGSGSGTSDINQRGLDLVKRFEGVRLNAYRDPVGIWTIGYGHTGPEVGSGDNITMAEAERLLKNDLDRFEVAVRNQVKVPLNSNQFSALVSFTYNLGAGKLGSSTLLTLLNRKDYQGASDQFPKWVYGGGKVLPGLVTRRREERALFLS